MWNLLEAVDPKRNNIMGLLKDKGDALWSMWVKPHLDNETKKPGTVISYLTSYEKFLNLVTHNPFNKSAPPLPRVRNSEEGLEGVESYGGPAVLLY